MSLSKFRLILLFCFILLAVSHPIAAQAPPVEVTVTPSTINISADESVPAVVTVRNNSEMTLTKLTLSIFTDTAVTVAVPEIDETLTIPKDSAKAWEINFNAPAAGRLTGSIHFQLDYRQEQAATDTAPAQSIPNVVITTIAVAPRTAIKLADVLDFQITSSANTNLDEFRPNLIYAVVTNKSDSPIVIRDLKPIAPGFLSLQGLPPSQAPDPPTAIATLPITLPAHAVHAFPVEARVSDQVQPGKYLLLFEISVSGGENNNPWEATTTATKELTVGIFGESEILGTLSTLGVGTISVLLLPGLIVLIIFRWSWKAMKLGEPLFTDLKASETIVASVAISLLVALIGYPVITRILGNARDYLRGYGFIDIAQLWVGSLLLTILGVFIYKIYDWNQKRVQANREKERKAAVIDADDEPIEVLRKLHNKDVQLKVLEEKWQNSPLPDWLKKQLFAPVAKGQTIQSRILMLNGKLYLEGMPDLDTAKTWVVSTIVYKPTLGLPEARELEKKIDSARDQDKFDEVFTLINEGFNKNLLTLSWKEQRKPQLTDAATVTERREWLIENANSIL